MSIINSKTPEELKEEFKHIEEYMESENKEAKKRSIIAWITSGALHLTILMLMGTIVYTTMNQEVEAPPVRVSILEPPPHIKPETKITRIEDIVEPVNVTDHDQEVTSDKTIVSDTDVLVTDVTTEDDVIAKDARGREEAISDSEMGGMGMIPVIGPGGGGKGLYGKRIGGGDKRAIGKAFGPNAKGVASSLDAALRWLKKHQSPDGSWSAINYAINCNEQGPKCEPGAGAQGADEALTGYAVLCFLGAGYDHSTPNKYKSTVKKGIEWILSHQKPDGLIGSRNYEHPIATMALVEAYGMSNDPNLRTPSQKAVDIILSRQSKNPNSTDKAYANVGWDYVNPNPARNDSSVTGWNVMALKSAYASNLNIKDGLSGSKAWLEGAWKSANPNWKNITDPYKDTSVFPYTWNSTNNTTDKDHLSFIGALCSVFLGHTEGDMMLNSLLNDMDKRWLETGNWKNNAYCIYYASLAAFQSGSHWQKWRDAYVPYLIQTQWKDEDGMCKSGTWNYGPQSFHGADTSRVLIHTYYTLSLEVAIRYDTVHKANK